LAVIQTTDQLQRNDVDEAIGEGRRRITMLRAGELRRGQEQIQFSLAALEGARLRPRMDRIAAKLVAAERALPVHTLNLSGSQILVAVVSTLVTMGLFAWAVIRLWLFGG
jgi:hypothetical protein